MNAHLDDLLDRIMHYCATLPDAEQKRVAAALRDKAVDILDGVRSREMDAHIAGQARR